MALCRGAAARKHKNCAGQRDPQVEPQGKPPTGPRLRNSSTAASTGGNVSHNGQPKKRAMMRATAKEAAA
jgi:hypothetical protein